MTKIDIKSLRLEEIKDKFIEDGEKAFRAEQVFTWIHEKLASSFDEMTNISLNLREKLKEKYIIVGVKQEEILTSKIDGTKKFLFSLSDGSIIESVLMKYRHGYSVCISSQVGCRQGCNFCASTIGGLERNLLASEMLDQIYEIVRLTGVKVSNIVLMGTGEPLDNYENVLAFIDLISNENGLHIGQRNITISTCGLLKEIYKLAEEKLQITLALSLHAADDDLRKTMMPIARKYSLSETIEACKYYFEKTKRRISFEYSLIQGINDSLEQARDLSKLLKGINSHVNLIPINPIKERDYKQSRNEEIEAFKRILEKNKIQVTVRREMGRDINGACGQLRKSYIEKTN